MFLFCGKSQLFLYSMKFLLSVTQESFNILPVRISLKEAPWLLHQLAEQILPPRLWHFWTAGDLSALSPHQLMPPSLFLIEMLHCSNVTFPGTSESMNWASG